ncbi:hypothetical protein [Azospirillum sp. TSO35-2]|uniref:hypothetical protein n=1 Tax=Azospirillum sp. TSO35-2 TaxID=716796 RepID=UPI000D611F0F|nr:hypothetical protein [Azospirillum sp. TSO35-2]PWC36001.1 hypothetical protein TSO352_12510 [Azospirillum sp. TSO35-2]
MHRFRQKPHRKPGRPFSLALGLLGLLAMLVAGPAAVRADGGDDAAPNRSPRVMVPIGGVQVVLVSSGDQLYAFVDRVDGNEPVEGASLTVSRVGTRAPVALKEEAPGFFVGPLKRGGSAQDTFTVSLTSTDGSGEQTAKLLYDDAPAAAGSGGGRSFGRLLSIALVSGAIGAMGSVMAMRWWYQRRRRAEAPPLVRMT